jgi:hypothetical protein
MSVSQRAASDFRGLMADRQGEPDGVALDDLHFHAEAERQAGNFSEALVGRALRRVAGRVLRGEAPPTGRVAFETLQRKLQRRLLICGTLLALNEAALASVAADLAEWYEPLTAVRVPAQPLRYAVVSR